MVEKLDAKYIKERVMKFLNERGPSLPVPIAKYLGINSLFASAFLSELASEGMIKISDMKIGGSPLYFTPEKVNMLENFFNHLGSKEREAALLLKEKIVLEDASQTPVIRVALRGLKDFAFAFKRNERNYWRYFSTNEEQATKILEQNTKPPIKIEENTNLALEERKLKPEESSTLNKEDKIKPSEEGKLKPEGTVGSLGKEEIKKLAEEKILQQEKDSDDLKKINFELDEKRKELEIIKKELALKTRELQTGKVQKKEPEKGKKEKKIEDKFLNEVQALLAVKGIEVLKLESFDKKQVFARVKINEKEHLLAAFDKKKIDDEDILKTHKKALIYKIPYTLFSKGEPSKKTKEAIEAYKNLAGIEILTSGPGE